MAIFQCTHCGQQHDGIPAFHADRPTPYWDVPEDKRESDVVLTSDSCVIADRFFFIHACLEVPILDCEERFTWGVWISLKAENFLLWQDYYDSPQRSHIRPFFGWLCTRLPIYPETQHLKTMVHLRDNLLRPFVELEATEHPLSMDQQRGITLNRALEIVHALQD